MEANASVNKIMSCLWVFVDHALLDLLPIRPEKHVFVKIPNNIGVSLSLLVKYVQPTLPPIMISLIVYVTLVTPSKPIPV